MNEMIKKVLAADENALNSLEIFTSVAAKLGYSQEEIDKTLEQADGLLLDEDELDMITGGYACVRPVMPNIN